MVETVKIRGKEYPIKVGYYVMKKVKERTGGLSLREAIKKAQESEDTEIYETLLYAALKQGAWEEDKELDLKEDEMEMALGSCFFEFAQKMASGKFFPKQSEEMEDAMGKLAEAEEMTRTKKKQT